MIYLDTSVILAELLAEDRKPDESIWDETLVSSRLLHYEVWNQLHGRQLGSNHRVVAEDLLSRISLVELNPLVLDRALYPFPIRVRTLDTLHLATCLFLQMRDPKIQMASFDHRMLDACRRVNIDLATI